MPDRKALWAWTIDDLELSVRAHNGLVSRRGFSKAWHAAVVCDACLLRTRNFGRISVRETRAALAEGGFPPAVPPCGTREWIEGRGWQTRCERDLQVCRQMVEAGQWE